MSAGDQRSAGHQKRLENDTESTQTLMYADPLCPHI